LNQWSEPTAAARKDREAAGPLAVSAALGTYLNGIKTGASAGL